MPTLLEIDPAYEPALRTAGLTDFDAFLRAEGGTPTSKHSHRETLPITIDVDGQAKLFFLKRVFKVPPKHAFWPIFRLRKGISQPRYEWHMLATLHRAGIPVAKPIAYGERRVFGFPVQAFLLLEAVPMKHTLENWLLPGFSRPSEIGGKARNRLLYEVGRLVGQLHRAGFYWPDIGAKHIFVDPKNDSAEGLWWDFCIIDVERMMWKPPASAGGYGARCKRVVSPSGDEVLVRSIMGLMSSLRSASIRKPDFWRMWSGVWRAAGFYESFRGRVLRKCPDVLANMPERFGVTRGPRLPNDFEHPAATAWSLHGNMRVADGMIPVLRSAGISGLDELFRYESGDALNKAGLEPHRQRVRMKVRDAEGGERIWYLKRYTRPPLGRQLRRMWECGRKRSSGGWEIRNINRLGSLGIPTLRSVAVGEEMGSLLEKRSFGITEAIDGRSLEEIARDAAQDPRAVPSPADRREIIRQLALITRRLHDNRLYHRDLYLCHVFLCRNADGGIVLRLIDLARMIRRPFLSRRWIVKDLAALEYSAPSPLVTRADRLRFMYDYAPEFRRQAGARSGMRRLMRLVLNRTRRTARHDAQRARRISTREQV